MPNPSQRKQSRSRRIHSAVTILVAGLAGFAVVALAAVAIGKTFTLGVGKNVPVGSKHESVVVNSKGVTVYWLGGDRAGHYECKVACFGVWPPVKVPAHGALTAASGVKGKLGRVHRGSFYQLTLSGHPLYRFAPDNNKPGSAKGNGISFGPGEVWHVTVASAGKSTHTTTTTTTTTSTSSSTSSCLYPPYC